MKFLCIVLVTFLWNSGALAQSGEPVLGQPDQLQLMSGALEGRNRVIEAAAKRDLKTIALEQLENAAEEFALDLQSRGDESAAGELREIFQNKILEIKLGKDLGDHSPLIPAFEDFLVRMSERYGAIIFSLPYVQDLRTLNFAIAVVLKPAGGNWAQPGVDARIEYRKHFIPFANIITYYASFYGCKYIAQRQGISRADRLCRQAAERLRFVMGRHLAPVISDFIFRSARRVTRPLSVRERQLVYVRSEQLLESVKSNSIGGF